MQTLIFNFKTKTVGVVGSTATKQALADVMRAQRRLVANSPSTSPSQQTR